MTTGEVMTIPDDSVTEKSGRLLLSGEALFEAMEDGLEVSSVPLKHDIKRTRYVVRWRGDTYMFDVDASYSHGLQTSRAALYACDPVEVVMTTWRRRDGR